MKNKVKKIEKDEKKMKNLNGNKEEKNWIRWKISTNISHFLSSLSFFFSIFPLPLKIMHISFQTSSSLSSLYLNLFSASQPFLYHFKLLLFLQVYFQSFPYFPNPYIHFQTYFLTSLFFPVVNAL